jgi:hypothetical protein
VNVLEWMDSVTCLGDLVITMILNKLELSLPIDLNWRRLNRLSFTFSHWAGKVPAGGGYTENSYQGGDCENWAVGKTSSCLRGSRR